tara:strand:+ start:1860 stop:2750 length:891 start_codon:yes stop_codon:yes gene_type:complete
LNPPSLPKQPKEINDKSAIRYIKEKLELENPDFDWYDVDRMSSYQSFDDISFEINLTAGSYTNPDVIVSVHNKLRGVKGKFLELSKSQIKDLQSKLYALRITNAKKKLLVLTDRSNFYALEDYLKSQNIPSSDKQFSNQKEKSDFTNNGDNLKQNFFIEDDNIEVRLIEFPVFVNPKGNDYRNPVIKKVTNQSLTFSQITGGLRYGFIRLENLPVFGNLAAPTNDEISKTTLQETPPKAWTDEKNSPLEVNVKEIIVYLFSRSGYLEPNKGKLSLSSTGKSSSDSSASQVKKEIKN